MVRQGKKATNKCSRAEGGFSGPSKVQGLVSNQTVLVATDNSTVVAYKNKQGRTYSAKMCTLLTWCHRYQITLKARHIPGCLNVMADLLSRSNQVQSTEWSMHPQVFKLKVQILVPFSHFGPVLLYRKLNRPMAGIHIIYIYILCKHAEI